MKNLALLIAVDQYAFLDNVHYAKNDGEAFAQTLKRYFGFDESTDIILMTSHHRGPQQARLDYVKDQIQSLKEAKGLEMLVFGFWGHGLLNEKGERMLCMGDTREDDLEESSVQFDFLIQELQQVDTRNTLVLLDCCQNKVGRSTSAPANEAEGMQDLLEKMTNALATPKPSTSKTSNTLIISACSEGQKAYEWDQKQHGLFTGVLISAFKSGHNSMSAVASDTRRVVTRLAKKQKREQSPYIRAEGDIEIPHPRHKLLVYAKPITAAVFGVAIVLGLAFAFQPKTETATTFTEDDSNLSSAQKQLKDETQAIINTKFNEPLNVTVKGDRRLMQVSSEMRGLESAVYNDYADGTYIVLMRNPIAGGFDIMDGNTGTDLFSGASIESIFTHKDYGIHFGTFEEEIRKLFDTPKPDNTTAQKSGKVVYRPHFTELVHGNFKEPYVMYSNERKGLELKIQRQPLSSGYWITDQKGHITMLQTREQLFSEPKYSQYLKHHEEEIMNIFSMIPNDLGAAFDTTGQRTTSEAEIQARKNAQEMHQKHMSQFLTGRIETIQQRIKTAEMIKHEVSRATNRIQKGDGLLLTSPHYRDNILGPYVLYINEQKETVLVILQSRVLNGYVLIWPTGNVVATSLEEITNNKDLEPLIKAFEVDIRKAFGGG